MLCAILAPEKILKKCCKYGFHFLYFFLLLIFVLSLIKRPLSRFIYYFIMVNKGYSHCQCKVYQCIRCLYVRLYPINVKTVKPFEPNFLWDPARSQGKFIDAQNYKKLTQLFFDIRKILKIHEQIFLNP